MSKKNINQISEYYKKKSVVASYDNKRFSGAGGKYINLTEIFPIVSYLKKASKDKKLIRVLDIGAGRGRLSKPIKMLGMDTYCLDYSKEMIDELSKFFSKNNLSEQSIFDDIKFKMNFDFITGLRFFDHFSKNDQIKILKNIRKKIDKDGFIVAPTLNKNSLESLISRFFPYGRYNYFYTFREYENIFDKAGLKIKSYDSKFFIPRGLFLILNKFPVILNLFISLDKIFSKMFKKYNAYYYFILQRK